MLRRTPTYLGISATWDGLSFHDGAVCIPGHLLVLVVLAFYPPLLTQASYFYSTETLDLALSFSAAFHTCMHVTSYLGLISDCASVPL